MRYRYFLLALIFCALQQHAWAAASAPAETDGFTDCEVAYESGEVTAAATEYHVPAVNPLAVPSPLDSREKIVLDEESYADVYRILKDDNSCSRFFGGPAQAVEAFNGLARRLKKKSLGSRNVAVHMSGGFEMFKNHRTGAVYRLFKEAAVNSVGPFFSGVPTVERKTVTRIGSFHSATRQAKALIFLHELGHLVPREGGDWALPNDGGDLTLSARNTKTVEENCTQQLSALKR